MWTRGTDSQPPDQDAVRYLDAWIITSKGEIVWSHFFKEVNLEALKKLVAEAWNAQENLHMGCVIVV